MIDPPPATPDYLDYGGDLPPEVVWAWFGFMCGGLFTLGMVALGMALT